MFDHIGFNVRDFDKSLKFYVAALAPLGLGVIHLEKHWAMIGGPKGRLDRLRATTPAAMRLLLTVRRKLRQEPCEKSSQRKERAEPIDTLDSDGVGQAAEDRRGDTAKAEIETIEQTPD